MNDVSNQNPDNTNVNTAYVAGRGDSGRVALEFQRIAAFALLWSIVAWLEWFLIPFIFPRSGGPVPYMAFAPQAILLFLGCVATSLAMPIIAFVARR